MSESKTKTRRNRSVSYASNNSKKFSIDEHSEYLPQISNTNGSALDFNDIQPFEFQVAGHQFDNEKKTFGMLKCQDGTVLKPVSKMDTGLREIRFYEQLQTTTDASLIEFRKFSTAFYGTRTLRIHDDTVEFLILDNACHGLIEPCVIDIKMGRVTCDPDAGPEKVAKEREKYAACKESVAFCIPGFQVHKITTDRLHRYNKEYGKRLNGITVIDALKIFLNGDGNRTLCRELIVKFLSLLWEIQKWAKTQRSIRLFSSSLLMVYDCKKLKRILDERSMEPPRPSSVKQALTRKVSFDNDTERGTVIGAPRFIKSSASTGVVAVKVPPPQQPPPSRNLIDYKQSAYREFRKLGRSHSFHHNYGDYLSQVKRDYASTIKELINVNDKRPWCDVKIIDFGHVYPAIDGATRDDNYIEAIDNLVRIFEMFLDVAE